MASATRRPSLALPTSIRPSSTPISTVGSGRRSSRPPRRPMNRRARPIRTRSGRSWRSCGRGCARTRAGLRRRRARRRSGAGAPRRRTETARRRRAVALRQSRTARHRRRADRGPTSASDRGPARLTTREPPGTSPSRPESARSVDRSSAPTVDGQREPELETTVRPVPRPRTAAHRGHEVAADERSDSGPREAPDRGWIG